MTLHLQNPISNAIFAFDKSIKRLPLLRENLIAWNNCVIRENMTNIRSINHHFCIYRYQYQRQYLSRINQTNACLLFMAKSHIVIVLSPYMTSHPLPYHYYHTPNTIYITHLYHRSAMYQQTHISKRYLPAIS